MRIRRVILDEDVEQRIITGMITDDGFCGHLSKMAKKRYFKIDFARQVFIWCSDYFKQYKKAPGKEIKSIFSVEQEKMREAEADLIKIFLSNLSDHYEEQGNVNYDHLLDRARDYFRERSLMLLVEKIQGEMARGRIEQAEAEVRNFNKLSKEISGWFNPFDITNINQVFLDDDSNKLFRLPGNLGEMSGDFERDWLIAFMSPMKRGKSWWLQELAIHALHAGLKVAYFSFEMNRNSVSKRIYKRIAALASKTGDHKYPVFDCERNQDGSCKKEERSCLVAIKAPGAKTPEFNPVRLYKPCTACKRHDDKPTDYVRAVWFGIQKQTKEFDSRSVSKKVKDFKMLKGDNLRIMAYPAFSASFDDAEAALDELEAQEGFVPDMIAFDYFDITNPGSMVSGFSERATADYVWKRGKGMAASRHCLIATVLQSNRKSISKKSLEQEDTAEDIRKLAHVDMLFALNQTPDEKEFGVSRISVIAHRHEEFSFSGEVMALQSFALGQPWIDDEWIKTPRSRRGKED